MTTYKPNPTVETKVDDHGNIVDNWITDEELGQRHPELWKAAREKVDGIEATWTPELRQALQKIRER